VKTIYRVEYRVMCDLPREYRERAGLTMDELADLLSDSLGWHKSQIGKVERGERRVDVFEVRALCLALGVPMAEFWQDLERRLSAA
jgi:transcriptional regulator with XRE-family HTH domain